MVNSFSNSLFMGVPVVVARWLTAVLLLLFPLVGRAECPDSNSIGGDFWLMFLNNQGRPQEAVYSLTAVCNRGAVIHVENPSTQWDTTVSTTAAGSVNINIPPASAVIPDSVVSGGGIHVTSNHPISLYASNFIAGSYDIATIYPTSTLRTSYMTQTYGESENYSEEVGIVAVEDNTVLSILPPSGSSDSVTLMRGQTYLMSFHGLSSIRVTSNGKPFALFQGNECSKVGGCNYCDHLYEQSFPINYWGNAFMLVSTTTRSSGDIVQITSLEDNCSLLLDYNSLATIHSGGNYLYHLPPDTAMLLQSTKPVSVCLYLKGQGCENTNGDPASVIIPPLSQKISTSFFQAINTVNTTEHYANVITPNNAVPYMKLDGVSIASDFTTTTSSYAYSRLQVTPGTHTLTCDSGGYVAWFYGLGNVESYAYITGSSILNLSEHLFFNGLNTNTYTGDLNCCQGDSVPIWVESAENDLVPEWFLDSIPLNIDTSYFQYAFEVPGDHLLQAVVRACDTFSAVVHIFPRINETFFDTSCFQPYNWRGITLDTSGVYRDTLQNLYGCDTVLELNLLVVSRPEVSIVSDVDCHDATFSLTADLMESDGWPFSWSSTPHDNMLNGHEHDTLVYVDPHRTTHYFLDVDYICPFSDTITIDPIEWADADWKIIPETVTYDYPCLDAYDLSHNVIDRKWYVNRRLQRESGGRLHYCAMADEDSLEVMLVLNSNSCPDTLRHVVPFLHITQWVPNVFTPGGETNNRFAVVQNEGEAEEMYIYNSNGLLIRHIEGPSPEWDGTRDGVACPQGTYVWLLRYRTSDQPSACMTLTGTVTLLR